MTKLRLAILGAGNVAESYIRQIRRLRDDGKDLELTAICSRTGEAAASLASRFGIATHGANYPALLERTDIDAVIILTPMQFHYEHARAALSAGKHVLV
ncbi:MAG: Gfo/Idh/MocA family protein, partial [Thermomicrobiales bacterium]